MEKTIKTTPKDFFLHLGVIASLYTVVIALLNLLFRVINVAFPQVDRYSYMPPISLPIATLIIVFPLFIVLSSLTYQIYRNAPEKKHLWVRKWLIMLTLFIAGIVLAGDLVTLLYYFLDGRELTTGFLLKFLSVLLVSGGVFGYYLTDLREKLTAKSTKFWALGAGVVIIASIVVGFSVIGSPATQRMLRYDEQKINDLSGIQWQVVNYWQKKGELPEALDDLVDPISSVMVPRDPQTGESYEYERTGDLSFTLCAVFNKESRSADYSRAYPMDFLEGEGNFEHGEGRTCFERTIDPERYPSVERMPLVR